MRLPARSAKLRPNLMPTSAKPRDINSPARTGANRPRILAADDQQHILEAIELLLKREGYKVDTAQSPLLVREALAGTSYDSVLIDLNYTRDTTSGQEGLDLLSEIVALDSALPVIVMTAWGNVELAVEAMRRGARDFIQKPWENERLLSIVRTQVELRRALQEAERLAAENRLLAAHGRPEFIASAPSMLPVLETLTRVAPSDANVLISGEHGTGKEVVAQTVHALSLRASRPFIAVNTGGLAEGVFESELFGHVKGAFTDARADRIGRFELADGGTIFVHEIGTVPSRQQAKLLRVIDPAALQLLVQYPWPGNVRDLEHTIERAVLMCRTDHIQPADLGLAAPRGQPQNLEQLSLEAVENILIRKALQRFQGNVSQAAEALGLSRGALYRRMEKYGL